MNNKGGIHLPRQIVDISVRRANDRRGEVYMLILAISCTFHFVGIFVVRKLAAHNTGIVSS